MKLTSYWLDSAPAFGDAVEGPVEGSFDVAVIGAGLTGLSCALELARLGARVAVLEAGRVVCEASGRNGGQCNNGTLQDYVGLVNQYGQDKARNLYETFNRAVDTVEALVRRERIDCGFSRSGKLKLAAKPAHYDKLARTCEALSADVDPDVKLLSPEQLRNEIRSDAFFGGLLQPRSASLHAGRFGVGIAAAAARQGASIYENATVTTLLPTASGDWRIDTTRGHVEAKQVFLATGGSGPGPFSWFRRRIIPVGSFIIVTEPLDSDLLNQLMPGRRGCVTTMNIGNYFRPVPDNRILFGGRARFAVSNPKSDQMSGSILRSGMTAVFPELATVAIDYCWGGSVDMSADRLPHSGQRDGIYYAMGYSGHGVQMAVHLGTIMADTIQGGNVVNPWRDTRWPAIPLHFGKPWFLPAVGAWYRLQDYLH